MQALRDSLLDFDSEDRDYITILPTIDQHRLLVSIYKHVGNGEYIQTKVSQPMSKTAAERVAGAWSAATGLEIRL
jgi:hypothetical protein